MIEFKKIEKMRLDECGDFVECIDTMNLTRLAAMLILVILT